jgi:xanthine dehydrogenase accessory factor
MIDLEGKGRPVTTTVANTPTDEIQQATGATFSPQNFSDNAALTAAADGDCALCTIVGIEGSFSRQLGAQLAIRRDGTVIGSLADGCLEAQLVAEVAQIDGPVVRLYGRGSEQIDFRLPCGSALHILIDPAPDQAAIAQAARALSERRPGVLALPLPESDDCLLLRHRHHIPDLQIMALGAGPELEALSHLAHAAGVAIRSYGPDSAELALGRAPDLPAPDAWTAVILLFHDHEWERELLGWALRSDAFYIGAQGGAVARQRRLESLAEGGVSSDDLARVTSPVGLFTGARQPGTLALSALSEIVSRYGLLGPGQ